MLPSKDPAKKSGKGLGRLFLKNASPGGDASARGPADPDGLVRGYSPGTDDHFQAEASQFLALLNRCDYCLVLGEGGRSHLL